MWVFLVCLVGCQPSEPLPPFGEMDKLSFKPVALERKSIEPSFVRNLEWKDLPQKRLKLSQPKAFPKTEDTAFWTPVAKISFENIPFQKWTYDKKVKFRFASQIPYSPGKQFLTGSLPVVNSEKFGVFQLTGEHGLPGTAIECMVTDALGRLWIGTDNGLALYTGTRIEVFNTSNGLPNNFVYKLLVLKNGHVLIGTKAGLVIFDGLQFSQINLQDFGFSNWITALEEFENTLWIGTDKELLHLKNDSLANISLPKGISGPIKCFGKQEDKIWVGLEQAGALVFSQNGTAFLNQTLGFEFPSISCFFNSGRLGFLMGTSGQGLYRLHNLEIQKLKTGNPKSENLNVFDIKEDASKNIWLAAYDAGLFKLNANSRISSHRIPNSSLNGLVLSLAETKDQKLLVGCTGGICILKPEPIFQIQKGEILNGQTPVSVYAHPDGSVYVSTIGGGLNHWKNGKNQSITSHEGLSGNNIIQIRGNQAGKLFLAHSGEGIDILEGEKCFHIGAGQGLKSEVVNTVLATLSNDLYIGTNDEGLYKWDGEKLFHFGKEHGLSNSIYNLAEGPDGKIFIGTNGDGLMIWDGKTMATLGKKQGLKSDVVYPILPEKDRITFGTFGGGLYILKDNSLAHITDSLGLSDNSVLSLAKLENQTYAIGTGKGLSKLVLENENALVSTLNKKDGLAFDDFFPCASTSQGLFSYFGAGDCLIKLKNNALQDTHSIQAYIASATFGSGNHFIQSGSGLKRAGSPTTALEVPYSENDLTLRPAFAGMTFKQDKARFAWHLSSVDKNWKFTHTGSFSDPSYFNLQAGDYQFRFAVQGANRKWSQVKTLNFTILPPWWETWWFRLVEAAFCFFILFGIVELRTRTLRRQKEKLEGIVKDRTAEIVQQKEAIELEKEKSENLLLNILPYEVAEELKNFGQSEARQFEEVTILFSDFKDFTKIAEGLSPKELVKEIDICFKAFDHIMTKYGVEKIKTIGDAYMAAGGIPKPNESHAQDVVMAALEIINFMEGYKLKRKALGLPAFEIRIGIHTGPAVAGIVGDKKFAYDIWGDSVNTASRMESSGAPGKINVSETTYLKIRDTFQCEPRGKIQAKNKGEMEMYFVEGKIEG
jgi:class 3 adenylate cyclase/ligand-binding sensor domain-containing protein